MCEADSEFSYLFIAYLLRGRIYLLPVLLLPRIQMDARSQPPLISEMKRSRNGQGAGFEARPACYQGRIRRARSAATHAGWVRIGRTDSNRMVYGYEGSGTP